MNEAISIRTFQNNDIQNYSDNSVLPVEIPDEVEDRG
jgi:hypothetical protein